LDIANALFRWMHILAAILWIGMLYFFNFVNGPFVGTMDGDTKKKVVPELMPRALFWFRWGAAWTWVTGFLLLGVVFYSEKSVMFGADGTWTAAAGIMVAVTFLAAAVYDGVQKSALGKNPKVFAGIAWVVTAVVAALMSRWAGFEYRALNIHLGAMFGTAMAFNVWMRIWPAQKIIIRGVKGDGPAAPPELAPFAAMRSKHNVYMSVPLFWAMINFHTTTVPTTLGLPANLSFLLFPLVTLVGWAIVAQLYKTAPKVKGF
jgi:uncharacterized membrane protein